jgi:hypothetical protein
MTDQNTTSTDATLQYSHPENLEKWPGLPEKNVSFEYRLRRLGSQHFGVHFFPKGSQDSDRLGSNNTIEDGIVHVETSRKAFLDQSLYEVTFSVFPSRNSDQNSCRIPRLSAFSDKFNDL